MRRSPESITNILMKKIIWKQNHTEMRQPCETEINIRVMQMLGKHKDSWLPPEAKKKQGRICL